MFAAVLTAADAADRLMEVARAFSPRVEAHGPREVTLDVAGLSRLFASPRALGEALRRAAADGGLQARIAVAPTRTAARLLIRARAGLTVVDRTGQPARLGALPIETLASLVESDDAGRSSTHGPSRPTTHDRRPTASRPPSRVADMVVTLGRWGLRTLGDLAALPPAALSERLGQDGVAWQYLARGEDAAPLVPAGPDERFEAACDLEWPLAAIEPLSFVVGRLLDDLCAQLVARDRAAAALAVDLRLVTRAVHARRLELPQPLRDARALRTLARLDLESHPSPAAIDRVTVRLEPAPARPLQHTLFTRPEPAPERVAMLVARLTAVMGEGRVGSPATVDAWRPGAFAMRCFAPPRNAECALRTPHSEIRTALRRFRNPVPARVEVRSHRPVRVATDRRGLATGRVTACAGPWRTSGCWWNDAGGGRWAASGRTDAPAPFDRDEWDVALSDGAVYRLFQDRNGDGWFVEGCYD